MKVASSTWMLCLLLLLLSNVVVGYQQQEESNVNVNDMDNAEDEENEQEMEEEEEDGKSEYDQALDVCRRNPTWEDKDGNDMTKMCTELTGWSPEDKSGWRDNDFLPTETKATIGRCIHAKFRAAGSVSQREKNPWTQCNELDPTAECYVESTNLHGIYMHESDGDVVTMSNALTEQEAFGIQALIDCMHHILPQERPFYEDRNFGAEEDVYGNRLYGGEEDDEEEEYLESGNAVTYTHALLQNFLPGVASSIYRLITMSYEHAHWEDRSGLPHPSTLGLRTAEYIHYEQSRYLGHHEDTSSMFTISIALSHPKDYHGGMFSLWSQEAMFKVPRLSAIAFLSETLHSITQVTGGERNVFVVELWPREDSPLGLARPVPDEVEAYKKDLGLAAVDKEDADDEGAAAATATE